MNGLSVRVLAAVSALLAIRSAAAQSDAPQPLEYRVAHLSAVGGGVYAHAADEWSLLTLQLANRGEHPVELLCTSYFDVEPTQQYGRRVWLPPRSRLQTQYPIRIPPLSDPEQTGFGMHTMVSIAGDTPAGIVRDDSGRLRMSETLRITRQSPVAGIVSPLETEGPREGAAVSPRDLITTAQLDRKLPRGATTLGDRLLPASDEGLRAFDQIIVADDRILADAAGLAALRQWLFDGGRLWVMLDRVDADVLSALLQNQSGCQIVDTVTLTSVKVTSGPDNRTQETSSAQFEQPVTLVRVLLDDEQIPFVVDGWPAAFTREYGAGLLLVTTLESTGWVISSPDRPVSTAPFSKLMDEFFVSAPDPPAVTQLLAPHVSEYIGYAVPSRSLVLGLLGGFVLGLIALGSMLVRSGRLERLAIAGPVLAVLIASVLMGVGRYQQQRVPPTRAILQLVQPLPGTDHVDLKGAAEIYAQEAGPLVLRGHEGGQMFPDLSSTAGTIRRLIHSDLDTWAWENLPRSPGVRTAVQHIPLQRPPGLRARAEFGPDGLSGRVWLPEGLPARDAVIATQTGRLGVQVQPDGQFIARAESVLSADQYVDADLLSDEQVRRSRVLADLLTQQRIAADGAPILCCWTDPWPAGVEGGAEEHITGAALVAIPLELLRPTAGTPVRLSPPLLPYRGTIGPDGLRPSGLYDHRRNKWTEKIWPSSTWLRFQLPQVLLPIELTGARITVQVSGPVGKLIFSVEQDGQVVPVKSWEDPIGTLKLELTGGQLPPVSADGGVLLRVDGGDPGRMPTGTADPTQMERPPLWQIESLQMEVEGIVGPATDPAAADPATVPER
jgi:hypothetical protein